MIVIPIVTQVGQFSVPHGLGSVPVAVVPIAQGDGLVRLDGTAYDAENVYLSASVASLPATLFIWS